MLKYNIYLLSGGNKKKEYSRRSLIHLRVSWHWILNGVSLALPTRLGEGGVPPWLPQRDSHQLSQRIILKLFYTHLTLAQKYLHALHKNYQGFVR